MKSAFRLAAPFRLMLGLALLCAALLSLEHWAIVPVWARSVSHGVVLLIPDAHALGHPVTQAWIDAATEEGLSITPMTDNRFVQAVARKEYIAAVVVPDTVHRPASDVWIRSLYTHVSQGGHLLLTYDAGLSALQDKHYAASHSRLSGLVGFRYGLYDSLRDDTIAHTPVLLARQAVRHLAIQPGKADFESRLARTSEPEGQWAELTTYGYAHLIYPHYRSEPMAEKSAVQVWMRSPQGHPILTEHRYGKGEVLFANLPLGYLKTRTDGYLLHRLLGHFGKSVLQLPMLSSAPDGVGGMVLNLHVDSNAAQQPMLTLERDDWFRQGPFSIHLTAGPDTYHEGDRLGLDMAHNQYMRSLVRRLHAQGHEIGNHGGWIHNVFGEQVTADNAPRFSSWLQRNQQTMSEIVGEHLVSYSAPMGNHPTWVTDWLEANGMRAYYTAGDCGLGPTRAYMDGQPPGPGTPWAFPISNLNRIATFEELSSAGVSESVMADFIRDLMRHVSDEGVVRLFYFHPASAPDFRRSLSILTQTAQQLQQNGHFRWYSMQSLADFLDRRLKVQWQVQKTEDSDMVGLQARSTKSLKGMTWVLPKGLAQGIHVVQGQAEIVEDSNQWRVIAGDIHLLSVWWKQAQE